MIHPDAARRIAHHFPDAHLIFVLRDPVERAYSQYCFGVMRGTQDPNQSFSELIRGDEGTWGDRVLRLGLYHRQLLRFERYFPHEQMMIRLFRDFKEDNERFVFQSGSQKKPSMKPADREYLSDYYAGPNRQLEKWLGRDLSHWS